MAKMYATPGTYVEGKNAFPTAAVPVATAVPAFVGYTEKAIFQQKDLTHVPTRIQSLQEYVLYFGGGPDPRYDLVRGKGANDAFSLNPGPRFLLFYCLKLFFDNGGSDCYIVSIGDYNNGIKADDFDRESTENGVTKRWGIQALLQEPIPTILVAPDAVSLPLDAFATVQQNMLKHCGEQMHNRIAILDVYDGFRQRTHDETDVINTFRAGVGTNNLKWGAAYYPWLYTSVTSVNEVDFTNINPETNDVLMAMLRDEVAAAEKNNAMLPTQAQDIRNVIASIEIHTPVVKSAAIAQTEIATLHHALLEVSPIYQSIMSDLHEQINLLPPSAAMAGIYSMVDNIKGVFHAPANVSMNSVLRPAVNLTHEEQEDLNIPINGKAVNAIRSFPGGGVLVWGARTLDGNSQDWRYVNVRRTVIFLEQSILNVTQLFAFEPNSDNTWAMVKAMVANFLTDAWHQGALAGASAAEAFSIDVGQPGTMTPQDILDGYMRLFIKVAVTRPAEFIELTIEQKMEKA